MTVPEHKAATATFKHRILQALHLSGVQRGLFEAPAVEQVSNIDMAREAPAWRAGCQPAA